MPGRISIPPLAPVALPRAEITPVPVVVVEGQIPAPPPTMIAFAAKTADLVSTVVEAKQGIAPLVPLPTVIGKVSMVLIDELIWLLVNAVLAQALVLSPVGRVGQVCAAAGAAEKASARKRRTILNIGVDHS